MRIMLLFAIFLIANKYAGAQDVSAILKKDSIIKENISGSGRYSRVFYTYNNNKLNRAKLIGILNEYPESAVELVKYKKQKTAALIVIPIFLASTIVAAIQADNKKNQPGTDFSKAPVLFTISIGTLFGGMILSWNNHIHKAIVLYNKQF